MIAPSIFICHDLDLHEETQFEVQIFKQLYQKLQKVHAEVILYAGRASDEGFFAFFLQHISSCQWFLLFQTESAIASASVQGAVNIAKMRLEQKQMQGAVRFIALPDEAVGPPPEWSTLLTFGATQDYQRALEKLLLTLPFGQEATALADHDISFRETGGARAVPYEQPQLLLHESPLIAPSPSVADLTTGPLPAMPVYKHTQVDPPATDRYTQVDPPGMISPNPPLMLAIDQPVKLPRRIPKEYMVLSAILASVLILGVLMFDVVLPLRASGTHPSGRSPVSAIATAGIWPTTNTTATAGAQASSTAAAQATASAQSTATANAQATAVAQGTATANAQATAAAQATASTPQGLYVVTTRRTPNVTDPLAGASGLKWDVLTFSGGGSCGYTNGAYHATMPQSGFFAFCQAEATNYSNFLYQVRMTILHGSGSDGGGLLFRVAGNAQYRLRIGIDGSYDLVTPAKTLTSGTSSAIKTGLGQSNLVAVAARGSTIDIYVNKVLIITLTDTTSSVGKIGVMGVDFSTTAVDVAFSNAQIWLL